MNTKRTLIVAGRILLSTAFLIVFTLSYFFLQYLEHHNFPTNKSKYVEIIVVFLALNTTFFMVNEWFKSKNKIHKPFPYFLAVVLIPILVTISISIILDFFGGKENVIPPLGTLVETITVIGCISLFIGLIHYLKYNYVNGENNPKKTKLHTKIVYKRVLLYALGLSALNSIVMLQFIPIHGGFSFGGFSLEYLFNVILALLCWYLVSFFNKYLEKRRSFLSLLFLTTAGTFIAMKVVAPIIGFIMSISYYSYDAVIQYFSYRDQFLTIDGNSLYIIFCALFYQFLYFNKTRAAEQKAFKAEIGKQTEKYESLRRQLSPHFLFNNINVLTALIEENPKKAVHFSESLGNIYRHFLRQENEDVVSLQSALSFSKDYLELLKYRYEEGFQYVLPETVDTNYYIIPLALQQVIENTIKHNEVSKENPLLITIGIEDDYLIVQNTKQLKAAIETTKKTGIENIKKRYAFLTEKNVLVEDSTTSFTIRLPLLNMENS